MSDAISLAKPTDGFVTVADVETYAREWLDVERTDQQKLINEIMIERPQNPERKGNVSFKLRKQAAPTARTAPTASLSD